MYRLLLRRQLPLRLRGYMSKDFVKLSLSPEEILNRPLINKGTAFTQEERDLLGLNGFIPIHVSTAEEQIRRAYQNFEKHQTPLAKYVFLMGVLNRNEHLFYQLVNRYVTEMVPIIYTPTVGEAAVNYSQIYFRLRGLYLSYPTRDKMDEILSCYSQNDIQVIVVTDGERILGLGDQGIGGMTIPIGKLNLYTLFGGIHPEKTLPILLDVGTNNIELLKNELYLGWNHPRLAGEEYDQFIDQFVRSIKKRFPKVLLQWEDFGRENARRLLDKYRDKILSFNDDIQGTASVALGGLLAATHVSGQKLKDQKIAILGGGSAGTGIADAFVLALQNEGLSEEEAVNRVYIVDKEGLLHHDTKQVNEAQKPYVKSKEVLKNWKMANPSHISMMDVVKHVRPTVLIGVSGQTGAFSREIIEEMARLVKRPIVFPLSNPTSKAEATPEELIQWTNGQAIIATGSPFSPVEFHGKKYHIGQCNNVYIFPGVGTGALASSAKSVTDTMFLEASKILAAHSPSIHDATASLFPPLTEVRKVCRSIAIGVAKIAVQEGVSQLSLHEIENKVDEIMWEPHYPRYCNIPKPL